jgi:probable O-glycosylation ligase (exosortase A-associated)
MRDIAFLLIFVSSLPLIFMSPFYGVLIWYVFSLGNFHTLMWGLFGNLYYAYIIAVVTAISWVFSRNEKMRLPLTPLVLLTLLFSLWMTLSSYFALVPPDFVWERWVYIHKILLMCLIGYALTTTRERIDQLVWVVVLSIGFWGIKGGLSVILHGSSATTGIHGPAGGQGSDNNSFGVILIMILPLLFYQWHIAVNRHVRRGLMVMGFLASVAVIFTYSRGALLGLSAMGIVMWLRSRSKVASGLVILLVVLFVFAFVPQHWFDRMYTIQHYEGESSATSRLDFWNISLRIAELHPLFGGGFRVMLFPHIVNPMLLGTNLPTMKYGMVAHSTWFEVLCDHGWIGLALFVAIAGYSLYNCSWLIRRTRGREDLAWANLLGRMGQGTLVGFWVSASFGSHADLDLYWCLIFIFDAARRVVAKEITTSAGSFRAAAPLSMGRPGPATVLPPRRPNERPGYAIDPNFRMPSTTSISARPANV